MVPFNVISFLCAMLVSIDSTVALPTICRDTNSDLKTFTYIPTVAPGAGIPNHTPLQFNGSYPGQGDVPGQLGWWESPPYTGNKPADLVSFVQYNADQGVVFWAERTAFEVYVTFFYLPIFSIDMVC